MRNILIAVAVLLASGHAIADDSASVRATDAAMPEIPVWQPEGGERIAFDVLRNGNAFGTHVLEFSSTDDGMLQVTNDIDLEVKIGPFTAYKYRHASVETWTGGQLLSLDGETRKEGNDLVVEAEVSGDAIVVSGTNFDGTVPADIIPSSHWNVREVFSNAILSSEGGQVLDITVENLGTETVLAGGEEIQATRFRLRSELDVDLWYDAEGRWVKCAFSARGQDIEYVLTGLY